MEIWLPMAGLVGVFAAGAALILFTPYDR